MLCLFDVDNTLLSTGGAGQRAMESAGRELFHAAFTCAGISFAGSLDGRIWRELAARNAVPGDAGACRAFRIAYAAHLERALAERPPVLMPGVAALVAAVEARGDWTPGVLSGNWSETGRMKLAAGGLDPARFRVEAWSDDGEERADLVPAALARCASGEGRAFVGREVVVLGDTPADVACAHAHGCRALAVATGHFDVAALRAAGADWAVADLSETEIVMEWIAGTLA